MASEYRVSEAKNGARLDVFISEALGVNRSQTKRYLEQVTVNGAKAKSSYRLKVNDAVVFSGDIPVSSETLSPEAISLTVLYEDDDMLVINKAAGMSSHASENERTGTLTNALLFHYPDLCARFEDEFRPGIAHRLDKDTTGILVIGKTPEAVSALQAQFKARAVRKIYYAIVEGVVAEDAGTITLPIARHPRHRVKMTTRVLNGRAAITRYKVVARFPSHTLLKLMPKTGRTHQIRAHLQALGFPIIGDNIYSKTAARYASWGLCLVAKELSFTHPTTGSPMHFEIAFPRAFEAARAYVETR